MIRFLFSLFSLFSFLANATPPLTLQQGFSFRLISQNPEVINGLGPKEIEVRQNDFSLNVTWRSLVRTSVITKLAPVYQMTQKAGGIVASHFNDSLDLLHPYLWSEGIINLNHNSILWVTPQLIESYKNVNHRAVYRINNGLSFPFASLDFKANDLVPLLSDIQNKIKNFMLESSINKKIGQDFFDDFIEVHLLDRAVVPLIINGAKKECSVLVLGNSFVRYTILDDLKNPLVISIKFYPATSKTLLPLFADYTKFLTDHFSYQITQMADVSL